VRRCKKLLKAVFLCFQLLTDRTGQLFSATPILNMKHKSAFIPDRPWMKPAIERAENLTQKIFNQYMDKLN